jgi:hypothetical protein
VLASTDEAVLLEVADHLVVPVQHRDAIPFRNADRERLPFAVGQDLTDDVAGAHFEDFVALRPINEARLLHRAQQDLEVDLAVGGVHSRDVVDEVGVHTSSGQGELDARSLRESQVAAFADDATAQLVGGHSDPVVASIRHVGVGLV